MSKFDKFALTLGRMAIFGIGVPLLTISAFFLMFSSLIGVYAVGCAIFAPNAPSGIRANAILSSGSEHP